MDSDAGSYGYPPDGGGGGHHGGLIILLLFILLAIASASGWGGHWFARSGHDSRRAAARKAIYKSIRKALNKALHARGAEQVIAATLLAKVVTERLRPFVQTGKPIFGAVGGIDKALSGKTPDIGGHGHDGGDGHGHGGDHGSAAATIKAERPSASTLVVTPNVITNIHVGGEPDKKSEPEKKKDEHGDKPKERPMTIPEQYAAVGKAVEDFDKAWQERDVEAFLKAAQEALLDDTSEPEADDHH